MDPRIGLGGLVLVRVFVGRFPAGFRLPCVPLKREQKCVCMLAISVRWFS
jgi:hypothetical protein